MVKYVVLLVFVLVHFQSFSVSNSKGEGIRVLLLSGRNNHDWKKTSPFLAGMFIKSGCFDVQVTENPDTLKANDLKDYDVLVSNWSSFPDKEYRWPENLETALIDFIANGGGLVTFHASTTAFYGWPEFQDISVGAWGKNTRHGKKSATTAIIDDSKHPVTKGMDDFVLFDELWIEAKQNPSFKTLASGTNETLQKQGIANQPVILVKEYKKGRIFHTTLGHDVRSMRNAGFQAVMLRGTEWAATGKVKQSIPQGIAKGDDKQKKYRFLRNDTTIALFKGKQILWQYNFNGAHNKPYFHPVYLGRNNMTSVAPDDHPWHLGQWFTWKFINDLNYWEYVSPKIYRSQGVTEIRNISFIPKSDFSASIELDLVYHPPNGDNVMAEKREIVISAPDESGNVTMDYSFNFEALAEKVELNRTPIEGEPGGKDWGGYGGLSLRFNQDFMDVKTITAGDDAKIHGSNSNWCYMEFTGIDGKRIGSQIMISSGSERKEAAWYVTETESLPFYYFGPAYLFYKPVHLNKGEKLRLNYRIKHYSKAMVKPELQKEYKKYLNQ